MNDEYLIRPAVLSDIGFITETIIAAEKSGTDKLSYSSLFELDETEVKELLTHILQEETYGCELSLNSFLIMEHDNKPIAASAGWIENFNTNNQPSRIIKTNLLYFIFPKRGIFAAHSKTEITKNLYIEREKGSFQIEYVYTIEPYRNRGIQEKLIQTHILNALSVFPGLSKVQVQVFKNNLPAIRLYQRLGFMEIKCVQEKDPLIGSYLPYSEKILMERQAIKADN